MNNPNHPDPRNRDAARRAEPSPDSPEEMSRGAHGRYGIEEEPVESPVAAPRKTPKTPEEAARDATRDEEVKNTGEDLG